MQNNNEHKKSGNKKRVKSFADDQSPLLLKALQDFTAMLKQERSTLKSGFNDLHSNLEYLQNRLSRKISLPQESVAFISRILKRSKINRLIAAFESFLELCKTLEYKIEVDPDYVQNMQIFLDSQPPSSWFLQSSIKSKENQICESNLQDIEMEFDIKETSFSDSSLTARSNSESPTCDTKRNRGEDTYHALQTPLKFTLRATSTEFCEVDFMDLQSQAHHLNDAHASAPQSSVKTEFQETTTEAMVFDFG
jgi:hypothetical protein